VLPAVIAATAGDARRRRRDAAPRGITHQVVRLGSERCLLVVSAGGGGIVQEARERGKGEAW
jgi:hypothetical protein